LAAHKHSAITTLSLSVLGHTVRFFESAIPNRMRKTFLSNCDLISFLTVFYITFYVSKIRIGPSLLPEETDPKLTAINKGGPN
jgi:hypothetical protein